MKKLVWTALAAAVSAAGARAAMRALTELWRRVTKESPPPSPRWAQYLVGKPTKAAVERG